MLPAPPAAAVPETKMPRTTAPNGEIPDRSWPASPPAGPVPLRVARDDCVLVVVLLLTAAMPLLPRPPLLSPPVPAVAPYPGPWSVSEPPVPPWCAGTFPPCSALSCPETFHDPPPKPTILVLFERLGAAPGRHKSRSRTLAVRIDGNSDDCAW